MDFYSSFELKSDFIDFRLNRIERQISTKYLMNSLNNFIIKIFHWIQTVSQNVRAVQQINKSWDKTSSGQNISSNIRTDIEK